MAKIRSTITGGTVNHSMADKRIYRSESCMGGAGDTLVYAQTNCRPLSSVIEKASVRTVDIYDWKTGTMKEKALDLVTNAKANINTPCIHPVTNARAREKEKNEYGSMANPCCYGSGNQTPAPRGRRK